MSLSKENLMGNVRTVAKHSTIYSTAEILKKGVGFILIPLYTRYLTPADYGVIEILNLILEVLGMLVGVRIAAAQMRYYHHYQSHEDKREIFTTALIAVAGLSLLSMLVLWTGASWLARIALGSESFTPHCQIVIVCLAIQSIFLIAENDLIIRKKSLFYSGLVIFLLILSLSLNIIFLSVFHLGIWAILWSILITKAVNLAVVPICLRGDRIRFSWDKLRPMIQYSLPLIPASFAMFILHFGDRFFLQKYFSSTEVGIYSLGYKFGMIISVLIVTPFQRVWGTHSFEIEQQPDAKLVYARIFTYFSLLLALFSLCICVFINDIIGTIAPPSYATAASIVPMIVLAYACLALGNAASLGILLSNKTKHIAFIQIPVTALNIILNFSLIPSLGMWGAALATLISFGIMLFITLVISQRLYPIAYEYRRLTILFTATVLLYLISTLTAGSWLLQISFHSLIVIALPLSLLALRFFSKDELDVARTYFYRIAPWFSKTAV
jgi:O-antigen/teichoic acid export membrane protein